MAKTPPLTGYEPNVTDTSDDFEVIHSFFQRSHVETVYDSGDNDAKSPNAETDDEHIRNALALPLYIQEREANASLRQAYHSNEESLLPGARSILAGTGQPVAWLTQERKSSQELDDGQIRTILERQKEQLLAEAKSEILRHEYKADHAENQIRALRSQMDSQELELGYTLEGHAQSRREQDLLHEELADQERALRDTRIRGIHKIEPLKMSHKYKLIHFRRKIDQKTKNQ